jgi:hypothetical protein
MSTSTTDANGLIASKPSLEGTHVSVQFVPLCISALASLALVVSMHLPWFGNLGDQSTRSFNAISGSLAPPSSPTGLVPGTQSWGYLLTVWAALCAILAGAAACSCVFSCRRNRRVGSRFLVGVGASSLVLVALVVPELLARAPFDEVTVGSDWGAFVGLGVAVVSSIGAWFAWATWTYPHRWGLDSSIE